MKALALTKVARLEIIDVPSPQIKNDTDVLLKIAVVGVCGSDIHYYETGRVGSQVVSFPYRLGHECSATVAQIGKGVKNLKPGALVVVEAAIVCHNCDQCKIGRENTCRNIKFLGTPGQFDGCICEYMVMPAENCLPVTGKLTPIQAAMCEPFTIGLYSAKQGQGVNCQTIAILGSGPIGLSCMESARLKGAEKIFITDKLDYRLNLAAKHGANWTGNPDKTDIVNEILKLHPAGVDVVYECAGQQSTIDQAADILRPGGKLILVGIPREDKISLPIDKFRRKELTVINIRRQNRTTEESIKILESAKVNVDYMVSHRFKFTDSAKAFQLVADYKDSVIKAVIEF
jgi:L-iditol 2-dehydrogenase